MLFDKNIQTQRYGSVVQPKKDRHCPRWIWCLIRQPHEILVSASIRSWYQVRSKYLDFTTSTTMPPRLNFHSASRSLTVRPRTIVAPRNPAFFKIAPAIRRGFAEGRQPPRNGSDEDVAGHVSEEARDMAEITGETPPDMGKSTNVQDVCALFPEGSISPIIFEKWRSIVIPKYVSY